MALDIYSDINKNYYIDRQTSDFKKEYDVDAVRNSVINILTTKKMERRMLPEFGASLEQILFEPITDLTSERIRRVIKEALNNWEPRVEVTAINIKADEDNMMYNIIVEYNILSPSMSQDRVEIVLQG